MSSFEFNLRAQKLLHQIKYQGKTQYFSLLVPFLPQTFPWTLRGSSQLIPVPLTKDRFFERGFNQAEWLAKQISKNTQIPMENSGLLKTRNTIAQSTLSRRGRQNNLVGAFEWSKKRPVPEQGILIDDVFTTGATLNECAKVLKASGVKDVFGWTLFRKESFRDEIDDASTQEQRVNPNARNHTDW